MHGLAQAGDGFGRGGLPQQDFHHIARQQEGCAKDYEGHDQQREQCHAEPSKNQESDLPRHSGSLCRKGKRGPEAACASGSMLADCQASSQTYSAIA